LCPYIGRLLDRIGEVVLLLQGRARSVHGEWSTIGGGRGIDGLAREVLLQRIAKARLNQSDWAIIRASRKNKTGT